MAFSGDSTYRNRGGCVALPDKGPLSPGRYLIVDRPQGGAGSRIRTQVIDAWNSVAGVPSDHTQWFALYRADGLLDDYTRINEVKAVTFVFILLGARVYHWDVLRYSTLLILH
ncbi:DUF2778 domain-containing protein [Cronobacter muytjensii]|nr:DUF2778 domain-containing protein [Cronobacter muytjensii]ELY4672824.1 DUF2778 domain-containing protein [Cronobacter muytjensii]